MNDLLEAQLAERLYRLADGVEVPGADSQDDVRRGRRRLRRRRALAIAGPAAMVGALAVAGFAATGSAPIADRATAPPVAERTVPESNEKVRLADVIMGLVVEQPAGDRASLTLAELQAMATVLQDRVQGGAVGWSGVGRATSWRSSGAMDCPPGWTCEDVAVKDASRARWASSGSVWQLVADLPSGVVVLTVNTADERPTDLAYRTD